MRNTRRGMICSLVAAASLVSMAASAGGQLDAAFGAHGAMRISFAPPTVGYLHDVAVVNGAIEAAGFERAITNDCASPFPELLVVALALDGSIIGAAHSYPQHAIACPASLVIDPQTGEIYAAGSTEPPLNTARASIARFNAAGAELAAYIAPAGSGCVGSRLLLDNRARFLAPCIRRREFGYVQLAALRLLVTGDQLVADATFGVGGFALVNTTGGYLFRSSNALTQDAGSGAYYVTGEACSQGAGSGCIEGLAGSLRAEYVIRLGATGALDTSYAQSGVAIAFSAADAIARSITVDDSGDVVIGGEGGASHSGYVARVSAAGTLDGGFGVGGVTQNLPDRIVDVRAGANGQIYALGSTRLLHLTRNGAPDPAFATDSDVQALNGPGSTWQAMRFVDDSRSSAFLVGGAACLSGCSQAATTAVIAKVLLTGGSPPGPPTATSTSLTGSADSISANQSVKFTAIVSGTSPTGTVTFRDGSAVLGTATLSTGRATYSTSALSIGKHSITAEYSGDQNNLASTSGVLLLSVAGQTAAETGHGGSGSLTPFDVLGALLIALWCGAARRRRPPRSYVAAFLGERLDERPAGSLLHRQSTDFPEVSVTTRGQNLCARR